MSKNSTFTNTEIITAQARTEQAYKRKKPYGLIAAISAAVAFFWILSPLDIVPDIIVGMGLIDDLLVACIPVVSSYLTLKQYIVSARNI